MRFDPGANRLTALARMCFERTAIGGRRHRGCTSRGGKGGAAALRGVAIFMSFSNAAVAGAGFDWPGAPWWSSNERAVSLLWRTVQRRPNTILQTVRCLVASSA